MTFKRVVIYKVKGITVFSKYSHRKEFLFAFCLQEGEKMREKSNTNEFSIFIKNITTYIND